MAYAVSKRVQKTVTIGAGYRSAYVCNNDMSILATATWNPEFSATRANAYQERHYMAGRDNAMMFAGKQCEREIQLKFEVLPDWDQEDQMTQWRLAGHSPTPLLYRGYGISYFWGMPSNYSESWDRKTNVWTVSLTLTEVEQG